LVETAQRKSQHTSPVRLSSILSIPEACHENIQTPPDLVVKFQPIDIVGFIL
jgi:hypothetical protein